MGLDTVELVLRCEEVFDINLPDDECGNVQTAGDLYRLVCTHLKVPPLADPTERSGRDRISGKILSLDTTPWTSEDVWSTLVGVFADQLQIEAHDVTPTARIHNDLGCD